MCECVPVVSLTCFLSLYFSLFLFSYFIAADLILALVFVVVVVVFGGGNAISNILVTGRTTGPSSSHSICLSVCPLDIFVSPFLCVGGN